MSIMRAILVVAVLPLLLLDTSFGYNANSPTSSTSRRAWLNQAASAAVAAAAGVALLPDQAKATTTGIISSKYCAFGQGSGCDDLAEGNPYIRQLQERSAANREAIELVRQRRHTGGNERFSSTNVHMTQRIPLIICFSLLQEARNAYYMKNYPDWFAAVGKTMLKKPDGSFMLVTDAELQALKKVVKSA